LRVHGFKNLVDVDVRFGPFTCVAGPNGLGKSNLFDAVRLLSLLADRPLVEAARAVRGGGRPADLFHRTGDDRVAELAFDAEMIVPRRALDDLGQTATASSTFLRYRLRLAIPAAGGPGREIGAAGERLEIREERLDYVTQGDAPRHLEFPHTAGSWRDSVVINRRLGEGYLSTGRWSRRRGRCAAAAAPPTCSTAPATTGWPRWPSTPR
jgi:hypothetical protein